MESMVREGKIDPTVIFAASQVIRPIDPKDYHGQVAALHEWVKKTIHYVKDPHGVELVRSPMWTLYYKTGDCDDQAVLLSAMAQAVGFNTRFKAIKGDPAHPEEFSHVYSQVLIPGKGWVVSDTIVPRARLGWESDGRFGAHTWGGLGMLGESVSLFDDAASAAAPATPAPATPPVQNIWGMLGDVFSSTVVNAAATYGSKLTTQLQQNLGQFQPVAAPVAKASILPSASSMLPLALAGAVGIGVLMVMRKKRR